MTKTIIFILIFSALCVGVVIPVSAQDNQSAQVTITNKTGATVYISFNGPNYYFFHIVAGKSRVAMDTGVYGYSYYACGVQVNGNLKVKGGTANLVLPKCPSVNIKNQTGSTLRIQFTGPRTYYFTLDAGGTILTISPGIYAYSYFACDKSANGILKVKGEKTNLVLGKCPKLVKEGCDSSYPTVCIPPRPPDLDCWQISERRFKVIGRDPHNFDGDHDGVGCEL